jgi:hypothetical protein
MSPTSIQHALCLHFHQPEGNLRNLLRRDESELGRILQCYERIARHAHKYAHVARLHVALSGVLLEQLRDPRLVADCRHLADLPAILEGLRDASSVEFIGTGLRHPALPLIPQADWDEQLRAERLQAEAVLGRVLKGYAPPGGVFNAAVVPALVRAGYEYVLLPAPLLVTPDGAAADPYRPYWLSHEGARIAVVPWDRGFSQAQEVGLDVAWFADEIRNGVARSPARDAPYLLTTWSDGENGEWFRRLDEAHGFFGQFFSPYMEFCETGEYPVRPVHLAEHLRNHPPQTAIGLRDEAPAGAGNPDDLATMRDRLARVSARYWSLAQAAVHPPALRQALPQARELILRAEESGYLLGDAARRAAMLDLLDEAERLLGVQPPAAPPAAPPAGATGAGRAAAAATVSQEKRPGIPPGTAARKATAPAKKKPPKRRR